MGKAGKGSTGSTVRARISMIAAARGTAFW